MFPPRVTHRRIRLGWKYDTRVAGNGNQGHTYGTQLTDEQKWALIEYLKTF